MTPLHVHLDPVGGLAGDMFVAALLSARPRLTARVMDDVAAVLPRGARAALTEGTNGGFTGRHFKLAEGSEAKRPVHYTEFRERIIGARLSPGTQSAALDILERLGRAEATVHGIALERVHFHEIADWDTLMDVVAAGSIAAALAATWSVAPLPLGGGQVRAAHGLIPVPPPAVTSLLTGYDWHDDGVAGERVTPTGAAILAHLTGGAGSGRRLGGRLLSVGVGLGTRAFPGLANMLRAGVFESAAAASERIELIAFDVDDMTGEEIATAADALRAVDGVRDLVILSGLGKKGRPLTRMELQAEPGCADAVADAVFRQTSTLGLRRYEARRDVLPRQAGEAEGLRVKQAARPGGVVTSKVEQDALTEETLEARRRQAESTQQ